MFRTTALAGVSPVTNTWIVSIDPFSAAEIRADTTSVSEPISSSARTNGNTLPAIAELNCG
jgi:hypothetical protein